MVWYLVITLVITLAITLVKLRIRSTEHLTFTIYRVYLVVWLLWRLVAMGAGCKGEKSTVPFQSIE
jgi:hypothetical protein